MLTKEQKVAMAQLVFNDKEVLLGEGSQKSEKQEKWIEIFIKLNALGANLPDYKSLRDVEWSNMRRAAEKKMTLIKENDLKPEEEKTNVKPLSPVDEIVLDILGKGNGTTQKAEVEVPENAGFLEPSFMARIKYEEDDDEDNLVDENDDSLGQGDDYERASTRKRKRRRGRPSAAASAALLRAASPDILPLAGNFDLMELRKKKLRLEITKLELEVEKLPLECAKLELEIQKLQRDLLLTEHHNMH